MRFLRLKSYFSFLGKPLTTVSIWVLPKQRFNPPFCACSNTLWQRVLPFQCYIVYFVPLIFAILTMLMDILTMTMVKHLFGWCFCRSHGEYELMKIRCLSSVQLSRTAQQVTLSLTQSLTQSVTFTFAIQRAILETCDH